MLHTSAAARAVTSAWTSVEASRYADTVLRPQKNADTAPNTTRNRSASRIRTFSQAVAKTQRASPKPRLVWRVSRAVGESLGVIWQAPR